MPRIDRFLAVAVTALILAGCGRETPSGQDGGAPIVIVEGGPEQPRPPVVRAALTSAETESQATMPRSEGERHDRLIPLPPAQQPAIVEEPTDDDWYRVMRGGGERP